MSIISVYQHYIQTFEPETLCWLLSRALDRNTMVRLCNTCGVVFPGMRTKSIPTRHLAPDLVSAFLDDPASGEMILKNLAKAMERELAEVQRKTPADIAALTAQGNGLKEAPLSRLIIALTLDARPEAHSAATALLRQAAPLIAAWRDNGSESRTRRAHAPSSAPSSVPDDLHEEIARLKAALQSAEAECARLTQHSRHLEDRVERLRAKVKALQTDGDAARHENRELQKTLAEHEREIQRLNDTLKEAPALTAQIHQLERENRKLSYELKKQEKEANLPVSIDPVLQTFERNMGDIKSIIRSTVETIRDDHAVLRQTIDDLQKEIHTLRVEAQRAQQTKTLRRPSRGEAERVGIFVDVQNMFYAARQHDARLDFEKLMQAAVGDRRMIRAIAYVIQTPEVDQSGFVAMLQQRSYQVKRKDLRLRSDGSAKGDWDMGMAIDMISMADKLDVIVLVSGDGDFVSLVNLLKEIGPRVEVFSFPHNTARDLMEVADRYYPIDGALLIKLDKPVNGEQASVVEPEQTEEGLNH